MYKKLFGGIVLLKIALVLTKEAELPLCPTNILYFPQNLPMHCRMPTSADFPRMSGSVPNGPQVPQNSPSDKQPPLPIPMPFPPGISGPMPMPGQMPMPGPMPIPGPITMPGQMAMPGPVAMPGPIGPSGPMPFPGPMPLSPGPSHKLPVIVMPFYSPDTSIKKGRPNYPQHNLRLGKRKIRHKRRRPANYARDTSSSTDTETSLETLSSSSSEYEGWWKGKRNNRRSNQLSRMKKKRHYQRRQLLTPVLQYVTKDGYVIFEKKISKTEAKDWLKVKKDEAMGISARISPEARDMESNEPIEDRTAEKETITETNVEVITKRNAHQHNRIKVVSEKTAKKKHSEHHR